MGYWHSRLWVIACASVRNNFGASLLSTPVRLRICPVALSLSALFIPIALGATPSLDSQQTAFVTLINNYRVQNGAAPLQVSVALQNSAQWMSTDMATNNYFSHTDSLGRSPGTRFAAFGYPHEPWGEDLAAGYSDAQDTLNQWINACDPNSSGACTYAHRQNMLNPAFVVMGIDQAYSATSTYGWYWTADFGGVLDPVLNLSNPAPTISSFTASPAKINLGQVSTLSWVVSGATSISINNGVGDVSSLLSKTVSPGQTTTYTVTASNTGGTSSATVTVTVNAVVDTQPPTAPVIVSAVAKSSTEIDLAWSASADNVGVAGYQITRNGAVLTTIAGNITSYADTSVKGGTTYSYSIKAFDAANNYSAASNTAVVTTPAAQASVMPTSVTPKSGSGSTQTFNFTFTDSLGYQSVNFAELDISSTLVAPKACLVYFAPTWNAVWLANNAGTEWTGPMILGSSARYRMANARSMVQDPPTQGQGTLSL